MKDRFASKNENFVEFYNMILNYQWQKFGKNGEKPAIIFKKVLYKN